MRIDGGDEGNLRSLGGSERLVKRTSRGLRRSKAVDMNASSALYTSRTMTERRKGKLTKFSVYLIGLNPSANSSYTCS